MGLLSSYVEYLWYGWAIIAILALALAFIGDMSMVISKIDGGNGIPWLAAHGVVTVGNFVIALLTFVISDISAAGWFLVMAFGLLVAEGAVSMGVLTLTIKFVTRTKR